MATRVRLTDAEEWPQHNRRPCPAEGWGKVRGMEVVIGKPVKADRDWICGTDLVWPVLEYDETKAQAEIEGGVPYVCRHQIQAGD